MKTLVNKFKKAFLVSIVLSTPVFMAQAQPKQGNGQGYGKQQKAHLHNEMACMQYLPDFTDEQTESIEKLLTEHQKEMMVQRNLLTEKEAKLNTLRTADPVDMKAVFKLVEEIGSSKTSIQKDKLEYEQDIRNLLTEEQKVIFNQRILSKNNPMHKGRKMAFHGGKQNRRNAANPNCPYLK